MQSLIGAYTYLIHMWPMAPGSFWFQNQTHEAQEANRDGSESEGAPIKDSCCQHFLPKCFATHCDSLNYILLLRVCVSALA